MDVQAIHFGVGQALWESYNVIDQFCTHGDEGIWPMQELTSWRGTFSGVVIR